MREARLGDVVASMKNGLYKPASEYGDDGLPCLRMYNIDGGSIVWRDIKRMRISEQEFSDYGLREGDLLVNRVNSRELVGKAAYIPTAMEPSVFESKNIRVRLDTSKALPKFINFQLFARGSRHFANNAQQVVGMASISQGQLADFPIVLTDLEGQRNIVAEIEKQFSRLDDAVANLQRVKANLKRYKASVLKAAVEGRLVETEASIARREARRYETGELLLRRVLETRRSQWSKKTGYTEPSRFTALSKALLPEGWAWATVEQLSPGDRPCAYGVLQPGEDLAGGVPFVRVGDINDGRIDFAEMKRIHADIAAAYPRTKLVGGEVLLTLVGAIGRTAVVPRSLAGGNVARAVGVLPIAAHVDANWVEIWFRNPAKILEMTAISHEVARKTLNLEDVRLASVGLPPNAEQNRIVAEVDRRLSIIREVEAEVDANLKRARALRQATLSRAFACQPFAGQ